MATDSFYCPVAGGVNLFLRVQPGASRSTFAGTIGDRLKVKIAAKAMDGQANEALCAFLADHFRLPKSCVRINRGLTARDKTIAIQSSEARVVEELNRLINAARET